MKAPFLLTALTIAAAAAGRPLGWTEVRARIVAGESASVALSDWCRSRGLPRLIAVSEPVGQTTPAAVRRTLRTGPGEPVRRRRVRLACGGVFLSEADNWYRPSRLSPTMNRDLKGRRPFGLVVRPLGFRRVNLAATPDPDPRHVLHLSAVLIDSRGVPFSYVDETYQRALARDR